VVLPPKARVGAACCAGAGAAIVAVAAASRAEDFKKSRRLLEAACASEDFLSTEAPLSKSNAVISRKKTASYRKLAVALRVQENLWAI
jgi:hypothetical protein